MSKKVIALLTAEHLVALDMVEKLDSYLQQLEASPDLAHVRQGLWEFSEFMEHTLHEHIPQEEQSLYPQLIKSSPQVQNEVNTLVTEHRQMEQAHRSLREELLGDKPATQLIINTSSALSRQLKEHIQKEHGLLHNSKH